MTCVPNAEWIAMDARSRAFDFLHLAGEQDQHPDDHPRPPAVHEVEQEQIVGHRERGAARPVDAFGDETAVHAGPAVRNIAGAEARDPGAEHQLDEQGRRARATPQPVRRAGLAPDPSEPPEVERGPDQGREQEQCQQQMRRQPIGADFGPRPRAPTCTMNQPTPPCRPPRTNSAASRQRIAAGDFPPDGEPGDADEKDECREACPSSRCIHSQKKMNLNPASVIPAGPATSRYCGVCLIKIEDMAANRPASAAGLRPLTRFHWVIDSPLSVSRVMPPITTIAKTRPRRAATGWRSRAVARRAARGGR